MKISLVSLLIILFCPLFIYAETMAEPPANFFDFDAGTEWNPFLLESIENLRWLSETPEVWGTIDWDETGDDIIIERYYFSQTADIEAWDTANWNNGAGFSPIGFATFNSLLGELDEILFFGHYDGNNHSINGLHIAPIREGAITQMALVFLVM